MSKFISNLVSENLINDWASVLDWLFDDSKFSKEHNWNSGYTAAYTKSIKKIKYLSDNEKRVTYGKIKHTDFPNQIKGSRKKRIPLIMMTGGTSFSRDLVRHIRNGIAHGQTKIFKVGDELYIEIIDYSDKEKKDKNQTAFLFFPLSYIIKFNECYNNINKAILNTKQKDRQATKKYKKENR